MVYPDGTRVFQIIFDTGAAGCPFAFADSSTYRNPTGVTDESEDFALGIHQFALFSRCVTIG